MLGLVLLLWVSNTSFKMELLLVLPLFLLILLLLLFLWPQHSWASLRSSPSLARFSLLFIILHLPFDHRFWTIFIWGPSNLHELHRTKCPLLTPFFLSLFLRFGYFSPRRVNAWGFNSKRIICVFLRVKRAQTRDWGPQSAPAELLLLI